MNRTLLEQLKKVCSEKGFGYTETENLVGVCISKSVWHWFNHHNGWFLTFNHSYSQNTGSTKKGVLHGIGVKSYVMHKTGIDIYANPNLSPIK